MNNKPAVCKILLAGMLVAALSACGGEPREVAQDKRAEVGPDAATLEDMAAPDLPQADLDQGQGEVGEDLPPPQDLEAPDLAPPDLPQDAQADQQEPEDPCAASPEEPNDSAQEAFPVQPGQDFALEALVCPRESDWFSFQVPAGETLTVWISFSHRAGDLDMRLWQGEVRLGTSETTADQERLQAGPFEQDTTLHLEVYGYRADGGPYTLRATSFAPSGQVAQAQVKVQYEDRVFDAQGFTGELLARPARHLRVEVVRELDGAVVGEAWADEQGAAQVSYEVHPEQRYRARALAWAQAPLHQRQVRSRDRSQNAVYALTSDTWGPASAPAQPIELLAQADAGPGGAFHMVDTALEGMAFISRFSQQPSPLLTLRWEAGRAFDCGSCYSDDSIMLGGQLEDTDEYDDFIILHEFGHWFVHRFSDDDSPGGSHRDRQVEPRLAYGEGLAYFWAGMVLGDPLVVDTFIDDVRLIDMEAVTQDGAPRSDLAGTTDGTLAGAHREEVVAAILWDALDPARPEEPFDQIEIGEEGHMQLLLEHMVRPERADLGPRGLELSDWLGELYCNFPEVQGQLQPLAQDRDYPWDPQEHASCEQRKGKVPALWRLELRQGKLWLVAGQSQEPPGMLRLRRLEQPKDTEAWEALRCDALPCPVAQAQPTQVVVVSAPGHRDWPGASWVGEQAHWLSPGQIRVGPQGATREVPGQ